MGKTARRRRGGAAGRQQPIGIVAVQETAPLPCWQLWIDQDPRAGWANMAIDMALLDRAEQFQESCLRLYSWQPHCLSFGRHEPAARRYDRDRIASLGLDTVRRPTGGRAVWHSREITYAVAAPLRSFGSLRQVYLEIHSTLADSLRSLGVPASLAAKTASAPLDAGACFAHPVGGEVMVGNRKVVGSAQLARGSVFLQHGSILLEDEQQIVTALTGRKPQPPSAAAPTLLSKGRSPPDLIGAISQSAQARWPGTWNLHSSFGQTIQAASQYFPHFRSAAWTWER
jgi:lipoate-protein ligase A